MQSEDFPIPECLKCTCAVQTTCRNTPEIFIVLVEYRDAPVVQVKINLDFEDFSVFQISFFFNCKNQWWPPPVCRLLNL